MFLLELDKNEIAKSNLETNLISSYYDGDPPLVRRKSRISIIEENSEDEIFLTDLQKKKSFSKDDISVSVTSQENRSLNSLLEKEHQNEKDAENNIQAFQSSHFGSFKKLNTLSEKLNQLGDDDYRETEQILCGFQRQEKKNKKHLQDPHIQAQKVIRETGRITVAKPKPKSLANIIVKLKEKSALLNHIRSSKKEYDVTNILKKKGVSSDLLKTIPVLSKGKNVPVKYSSAHQLKINDERHPLSRSVLREELQSIVYFQRARRTSKNKEQDDGALSDPLEPDNFEEPNENNTNEENDFQIYSDVESNNEEEEVFSINKDNSEQNIIKNCLNEDNITKYGFSEETVMDTATALSVHIETEEEVCGNSTFVDRNGYIRTANEEKVSLSGLSLSPFSRINDYDEQNIDNRCSLSESITQLCSNNNFITQEKDMNSENFFLPSQSLERVELTEENEEKEVYSKEIGVPVKNSSAPLLGPPPMKTTSSEKLENEGKILDDEAEVSGSDVSEDEQVEGSEADDGFLLADEDSEEEQDEKNLIKKIREMEKERDTREVEAIKAEVISGYKRHMYQFQDEQEALLAAARRRAKKDREKYKDAGNGHGVVGFGFFDEVLNFKEENIQERFLMVDKHKFFSESKKDHSQGLNELEEESSEVVKLACSRSQCNQSLLIGSKEGPRFLKQQNFQPKHSLIKRANHLSSFSAALTVQKQNTKSMMITFSSNSKSSSSKEKPLLKNSDSSRNHSLPKFTGSLFSVLSKNSLTFAKK